MKKFILLYKGPATDMKDMSEESSKAVMAKWGDWMGKVGSAMVDVGQPMVKQGVSVVDDGSTGTPAELNGYTIIQAEDMNDAQALVDGHPFLSDKTGKFSVDIYELMPVPEM
ncbi:MAG: hypothetical protein COU47_01490 [Candidatus Niyogibacteria bacterium CG10_big_fil_rev_8_21_14_0_10_46_36]|uniref:YCII-related domain-containing protein n=1 Tax=Candidatus Niyogibacteria bacterium CG10_big_fil_rev_8_21_14_0_10_46_36 TaxID=1974726 RepID=A0A2H0TDV9_9BACT|nr:MAG: hypothetical protein COU47_01490 [Candidatus Niyogibacteria bacterium CG10_big_fil_rev_8_21_14_0_10_46_36]